jgi:CelD/BcsL family acetyltransferase involved in cellulose biosynthesis
MYLGLISSMLLRPWTEVGKALADELVRESRPGQGLTVEVASTAADLNALRAGWKRLETRGVCYSLAQTFDYADLAWAHLSKAKGGAELATITIWRGDLLVCVWPLFTRRTGGATEVLHLGSGSNHEYTGPLLAEDGDVPAAVSLALKTAMDLGDILRVYNAPAISRIAAELKSHRALKHASAVFSPVISLRRFPTWEAWANGKSKSFRSGLRYDRRRLANAGRLEQVRVSEGAEAQALVDWLFETKRAWLKPRKLKSSPVVGQEAQAFFKALFGRSRDIATGPDIHGFALKLDGAYIAAAICFSSSGLLEFFMTGFDPELAEYSPGNLLIEDCVTWAIGQGMDFDFRITPAAYKARWADRGDRYDGFVLATSPKGAPVVLAEHARALTRGVRQAVGPRIKALARRRPRGGR